MANPAELLYETFSAWRTKQGNALAQRRGLDTASGATPDFIEHQVVIRHLMALREIVDGWEADGRDRRPYREALHRWWAFALAYPQGWNQPLGRSVVLPTDHDLDLLHTMADDLRQDMPVYDAPTIFKIREAVEESRGALRDDLSIPRQVRRHLYGLLAEIERCLSDYDTFGDFDLTKAISRLKGLVEDAVASSSAPGRWEILKRLLRHPMLVGVLSGIVGAGATTAATAFVDQDFAIEREDGQISPPDDPAKPRVLPAIGPGTESAIEGAPAG